MKRISCVNTSFGRGNVYPALILAAISGEVLQFAMTMCTTVIYARQLWNHSYISRLSKQVIYVLANESCRMAV